MLQLHLFLRKWLPEPWGQTDLSYLHAMIQKSLLGKPVRFLILLGTLVLGCSPSFAQIVLTKDTTIQICSGTLADSGGPLGGYGMGERYTAVFCPVSPGDGIRLLLTSLDLGAGDTMRIYDGMGSGSALLRELTVGSPDSLFFQASQQNSSGCLSVQFVSDGADNGAGWLGTLSCGPRCQRMVLDIRDLMPARSVVDTSHVVLCPGNFISALARLSFPENNTSYTQTQESSAFFWQLGDGTQQAGAALRHTYLQAGIYDLRLKAVDAAGCQQFFDVAEVLFAPGPGVARSNPAPSICEGDTITWRAGTELAPTGNQIGLTPGAVSQDDLLLEVEIEQVKWRFSGDFIAQQQGFIAAVPTSPGLATYVLQLRDVLGCVHEVPVSTSVLPLGSAGCSDCLEQVQALDDLEICSGDSLVLQAVASASSDSVFTFKSNPQYAIGHDNHPPDNPYASLLPVSALPFERLTQPLAQIQSVCLTLQTDWDEDITAMLVTPSGQQLLLFKQVGGGEDDFSQTCFSPSAISPIEDGFAPFYGTYIPQGAWNDLQGADVIGNWKLLLSDSFDGTQRGRLESWEITFLGKNALHYSWTPSTAFSCMDCPSTVFHPNASGAYSLEVQDNKGCISVDTFEVIIREPLVEPEVTCSFNRSGQAEFSWNSVPGAQVYKVGFQINGIDRTVELPALDTFFLPADFYSEGDVLRLTVEPLPDSTWLFCGSSIATVGCVFEACRVESSVLSLQNVSCYGGADGVVVVGAAGGFPPYQYQLNGMGRLQPSNRLSGLRSGDHFVLVFDNTSCVDTLFFQIGEPDPVGAVVSLVQPIRCADEKTAVLKGTSSGGVGVVQLTWSNGVSGSTLAGIGAGKYILTALDANGCSGKDSILLTNPEVLQLVMVTRPIECAGMQNGLVQARVSGGAGKISYRWNDGSSLDSLSGLGAGRYCVEVADENGCTVSMCSDLQAPTPLRVDSTEIVGVDCQGRQTGEVLVFMSGGNRPYRYKWGDPLAQSGPLATMLSGGPVSLEVSDAAGCIYRDTLLVPEPAVLEVRLESDSVRCRNGADGKLTAITVGGTVPYSYKWNTGNVIGNELMGVEAARYAVTVTDGNGCKAFSQGIVYEPVAELTTEVKQVFQGCYGAKNNIAQVIASGGNGQYSYHWNTGENGQTLKGLDSLTYSVTVSDRKGCLVEAKKTMKDLPPIVPNMIMNAPFCFGGSNGEIGINFIEGRPLADFSQYQFQWSTGASGPTVSNLLGDRYYSVTVTDPIGCKAVTTRYLRQPSPIEVITDHQDVRCAGGTDGKAWVSDIKAERQIFTYRWEVATGIVASDTVTGLPSGKYKVVVSDDRGCFGETVVSIGQPVALQTRLDVQNNLCLGDATGAILLTGSGGTGSYKWNWSDGGAGSQRKQLRAGRYEVTLSDANGCQLVTSTELVPESNIQGVVEVIPVTCHSGRDGGLEIAASGGVPPYTYSLDGQTFRPTPFLIGLGAGTYDVYIRDGNGCRTFKRAQIPEPALFEVDGGQENYQIKLGDTLLLNAFSVGAQGFVAFEWQAPYAGTLSCVQCPQTFSFPQSTITYELVGTDSAGCTAMDRVTVHVGKDRVILVPTGFTPNGDGLNDRLLVHGLTGTRIRRFQVFDRWGGLVFDKVDFEVNQEEAGWDGMIRGEAASPGVYVWYLEATYLDGYQETKRGQTTLIR